MELLGWGLSFLIYIDQAVLILLKKFNYSPIYEYFKLVFLES